MRRRLAPLRPCGRRLRLCGQIRLSEPTARRGAPAAAAPPGARAPRRRGPARFAGRPRTCGGERFFQRRSRRATLPSTRATAPPPPPAPQYAPARSRPEQPRAPPRGGGAPEPRCRRARRRTATAPVRTWRLASPLRRWPARPRGPAPVSPRPNRAAPPRGRRAARLGATLRGRLKPRRAPPLPRRAQRRCAGGSLRFQP
mmetsp:Transcript_843/g.2994  ORF Transcript_843/g.2994 Transcript_843/m.2994 type:complete len:200 (-) Transcript_843:756-1355(-)